MSYDATYIGVCKKAEGAPVHAILLTVPSILGDQLVRATPMTPARLNASDGNYSASMVSPVPGEFVTVFFDGGDVTKARYMLGPHNYLTPLSADDDQLLERRADGLYVPERSPAVYTDILTLQNDMVNAEADIDQLETDVEILPRGRQYAAIPGTAIDATSGNAFWTSGTIIGLASPRRYKLTVTCRATIRPDSATPVQGIARVQVFRDSTSSEQDVHFLLPGSGTYFASWSSCFMFILTSGDIVIAIYNIGGTTARAYFDQVGCVLLEDVGPSA